MEQELGLRATRQAELSVADDLSQVISGHPGRARVTASSWTRQLTNRFKIFILYFKKKNHNDPNFHPIFKNLSLNMFGRVLRFEKINI